ncbi:MAG: aminotransferase class IV [Proteobacteria bacterium]|nr:aminotransferase class IV [Pseudomonadota bacterium]
MADALPICLLDGAFLPTEAARVSPFDRGFLFGDGIYEVVPCCNGRPLRLPAHLQRLQDGLGALGIANPHSVSRWTELVHELIAANGGGDLGLYLQVTRGPGRGRDFLPQADLQQTVFGFCWRLAPAAREQLERGLAAVTLDDIRWLRCDIKSIALLGPVMLRMQARDQGADEAILIRDGRLAEGSSSAVFVAVGGRIITPPASHERLPSVTRLIIIEVLAALGLPLDVREVARDELAGADEIWIASSTRDAMPIAQLDGHAIGTGKPGPLWHRVYDAMQELKQRETAG